jgi:hypothetical protein
MGLRLLLADEDDVRRREIQKLLRAYTHVQVRVTAGVQALEIEIQEWVPDVIIASEHSQGYIECCDASTITVRIGDLKDGHSHIGMAIEDAISAALLRRFDSFRTLLLLRSNPANKVKDASSFQVPTEAGPLTICADDLNFVEAAANYIKLHTTVGTYEVRYTMRAIEHRLAASGFVRLHRCYLVNRRCIEKVVHHQGQASSSVYLSTGVVLKAGGKYREGLLPRA